jgi:hypothetical protein
LQQVIRHARRGLGADTGQDAQGVDQGFERGGLHAGDAG